MKEYNNHHSWGAHYVYDTLLPSSDNFAGDSSFHKNKTRLVKALYPFVWVKHRQALTRRNFFGEPGPCQLPKTKPHYREGAMLETPTVLRLGSPPPSRSRLRSDCRAAPRRCSLVGNVVRRPGRTRRGGLRPHRLLPLLLGEGECGAAVRRTVWDWS